MRGIQTADLLLGPLSLTVESYQFPHADEYWDANWLNIVAEIELPGQAWVKAVGPFVMNTELVRFRDELRILYDRMAGEASLWTVYPQLKVRLLAQSNGGIEARISLTPNQMTQQHRFFVELDQSYLPSGIQQIDTVLERFPIRGRPD